MSVTSAKEFVARLQSDRAFREDFAKAQLRGDAALFLSEMGFAFTAAELLQARDALGNPGNMTEADLVNTVPMRAICGCNPVDDHPSPHPDDV
jgi:predicted ribosomally synthesized peptide with nif11-like leader